jgi:hypothetical protein
MRELGRSVRLKEQREDQKGRRDGVPFLNRMRAKLLRCVSCCAKPKSAHSPHRQSGKHHLHPRRGRPSTFPHQECGACIRWEFAENPGAGSRHRSIASTRCRRPQLPGNFGQRCPAVLRGTLRHAPRSDRVIHLPGTEPLPDLSRERLHSEPYIPRSSTVVNGRRQRWTRAAGWLGDHSPQTTLLILESPTTRQRLPADCLLCQRLEWFGLELPVFLEQNLNFAFRLFQFFPASG